MLSKKKFLIIGGSGFVGTRLISRIGEGNCINIDKNPSNKFNSITRIFDIRGMEFISEIDPSAGTVILLAAEHRDDVNPKSLYYDVNVEGTRNVLKAMDNNDIKRIVFTSSVAVYGLNKINPAEDHPADPFNHYGRSKWQAEELLREWYQKDPVNRYLVIIRPTVIFGENNRGNVYNLLKQIVSGRFLMVGKGKNKKSMAYVDNVASFIKFCSDKKVTGYSVYNYVDKPDLTMNELVGQIEKKLDKKLPAIKLPYWLGYFAGLVLDLISVITGRKLPVNAVRVKKFCATTQFDASKILNSGFSSEMSLVEALNRTIQFEFLEQNTDEQLFYSE